MAFMLWPQINSLLMGRNLTTSDVVKQFYHFATTQEDGQLFNDPALTRGVP